jgi:hypothetical protein
MQEQIRIGKDRKDGAGNAGADFVECVGVAFGGEWEIG